MISHIVDVHPNLDPDELVANLVPPPLFQTASFESYQPSADYPSQLEAVEALRAFSDRWGAVKRRSLFGRSKKAAKQASGIYLDGGFGVGKSHLLAALWNTAPQPKAYGTFLEYTSLVGALGFENAVAKLRGYSLLCIDEFELDDPGDTMIMTRLLKELAATGTSIVATSNTPPNALGEGRFAASDFMREIQSLASIFQALRIDGQDYRRRDVNSEAIPWEPAQIDQLVAQHQSDDLRVSQDAFADVIDHISTLHPVQYFALARSADAFVWSGVGRLTRQDDALRLVALIDRLYDAQKPIVAAGLPLTEVFSQEMIDGGYRKKYLRCVSRLDALTTLAHETYDVAKA
ncbi:MULTISPECIES: cell division protein ZapE [unclassified Pseudoclavibacter]|uniref:cell division protein ZapE n=1 Tax=unclassified Pseudoclavibacter TaxID=2615177 RepID=UPI001300D583|nr:MULTISPECIES: cell division protein ZapE [unclassified Pseudoclavibacter]KAB1646307.1 cell division protein ZapE [Pseudoclavibacter sp. CFCC 14310]KAB1663531.1 cell division protein ZapE [Pseudoclavibacter sp. CFCC 13611]